MSVWTRLWVAMSFLWLILTVVSLSVGDWSNALDRFTSAAVTGYVAFLLHDRERSVTS